MNKNPPAPEIKVIVFDLGGVIIELSGLSTMMSWTSLGENELWHQWLHSSAVRQFESGQSKTEDFAQGIVEEFELPISAEEFINHFTLWPNGCFPGAMELLSKLSGTHRLACLSNTNHLHWQRFQKEETFLDYIDHHYASHQTGLLKPDIETYEHLIQGLNVAAESILFFDDNSLNVEAALKTGLLAKCTKSLEEVKLTLRALRLL